MFWRRENISVKEREEAVSQAENDFSWKINSHFVYFSPSFSLYFSFSLFIFVFDAYPRKVD